jgi:hypothetical protein
VGPRAVTLNLLLVGAMSSLPTLVAAQASDSRQLHAVRVVDAPVIDGRLDEPIWTTAVPISGFRQRDPVEGEPASEETVLRLAYDEDALYVGAGSTIAIRRGSSGSCRGATSPSRPTP